LPGWFDYPALFRHMTVAVYNKSGGGGAHGVIKAMKITRDQLGKWGYLYHRGGNEVLEGIKLTGKGWVKNQKHISEGFAGQQKDLQFASLFKMVEPMLYELDGPGGVKPPKGAQDSVERANDDHAKEEFDVKPKPT